MALAFLAMTFTLNIKLVGFCMAVAGIGWASILALPFAMLSRYIKPGNEGSVMGIFNIFYRRSSGFSMHIISMVYQPVPDNCK